jgi:hypothetical protein
MALAVGNISCFDWKKLWIRSLIARSDADVKSMWHIYGEAAKYVWVIIIMENFFPKFSSIFQHSRKELQAIMANLKP